ncbi:hypothetical protein AAF712_014732 [Marasmius tenuissimus]|uniref:F-box domain-containing protein n=1 Tax=Marasmius tenuissimus TaxID=585030 RepID=A0ABR2ZAJ0_9AGAR
MDFIGRLPPEILRAILRATCDSYDDLAFELSPMNPQAQPHVFRNVSAKWRTLADSERHLWQRISVAHHILLPDDGVSAGAARAVMERWLISACGTDRMGYWGQNKQISFGFSTVFGKRLTRAEEIAVGLLLKYSMYWHRVVLRIHPIMLSVFSPATRRIDNLASLHLIFTSLEGREGNEYERFMTLFKVAPRLKHFHFGGGLHSCLGKALLALPWNQITRVEVTERANYDFYYVMKHAVCATSALVRPVKVSGDHVLNKPRLELPKLRELNYEAYDDIDSSFLFRWKQAKGGLLGHMVLPGLDTLVLESVPDDRSCEEALKMLHRSHSKITYLVLRCPECKMPSNWAESSCSLINAARETLKSLRIERCGAGALTYILDSLATMLDDWDRGVALQELFVDLGSCLPSADTELGVMNLMSSVCERNEAVKNSPQVKLAIKCPLGCCLQELRDEWRSILNGRDPGDQVQLFA